MQLAATKRKPLSAETRKKISNALRGKKKTAEHVAKVAAAVSNPSEEVRRRKSEAQKRRVLAGKNNFFAGGISKHTRTERQNLTISFEYQSFRREVIRLDGGKCRKCMATENLHVHHIKSFKDHPELRMVVSNAITLCNSCHKKIHKK